jgi:hypothetical protein
MAGAKISLFWTSILAVWPTYPFVQWAVGFLGIGVKRLGRLTDHLPTPDAEAVKEWNCTSTVSKCLRGVYGDKFTV